MSNLPPPPSRDKDLTGPAWQKWFTLIQQVVSPVATGGLQLWDSISKRGSNLTHIETRNHGDLQNLNSDIAAHLTGAERTELTDGGKTSLHKHDHALQLNLNTTNYTHLTAAQATDLTDGGETILHKHNFDHVNFPVTNQIGTLPANYTLSDLMNYEWSAGVVSGCDLTNNGNGTVSISSGVAVLRASTVESGTLYGVGVSAQINIALTDDSANYIYLDYNAGSPVFSVSTALTSFNCLDKCIAYVVHRHGNTLHWIDARNQNVDGNRKMRQLFLKFSRFIHASEGTALGANGLTLTVTAGSFYFMLEEVPHPAFDTSIAGTANANVFTLWSLAGSTWTSTELSKVISTTLYNDTATGTITLGNNKYGVSWVYIVNDSPSELHVVMGQQEYPSLAAANVATPPSSVPTLISSHGALIGYVVYEKAVTVFDNILSSFSQTFVPSAATIHNGLSNLQGGAVGEYYHLTAAEYAALGATAITLATARQVSTLRV